MTPATVQPKSMTGNYRRHAAKPCHVCNGMRAVTRMEAKRWGGSINGVTLHGHLVPKRYVCEACSGTGSEPAA